MTNPTTTKAWAKLQTLANNPQQDSLHDAFSQDTERGERYQIAHDDLLFNYSRQRINDEIKATLIDLANQCQLGDWTERLFSGDKINHTEGRAVLHTALRDPTTAPIFVDGVDVKPAIAHELKKMSDFVSQVHEGQWLGYTGKPINKVISIGIGGSDLGPKMAYEALKAFHVEHLSVSFVSNLDSADFASILKHTDAETTLFIIASKTFTTQETMRNARTAREWFLRRTSAESDVAKHFVALSTAIELATEFGIDEQNIFEFWDWVGGRYSLWSAIGLPLALGVGMVHFKALLDGAYAMDQHFQNAPYEENIPVLMALLGIWNRNFLDAQTLAIIPYAHLLSIFPAFLQQMDMESNGKSTARNGEMVDYATGPIIWGSTGNNAQHAYFQHLHQGRTLVPIDFIGTINNSFTIPQHQELLFSNMVGQSETMMMGKTDAQARQEHQERGLPESLVPYRVFHGNTPSSLILINHLTPYSLGQLVAMYEHKVFVQGIIWNINSFDQWGVELGKQISGDISQELVSKTRDHSSAATAAIDHFVEHYLDEIKLS